MIGTGRMPGASTPSPAPNPSPTKGTSQGGKSSTTTTAAAKTGGAAATSMTTVRSTTGGGVPAVRGGTVLLAIDIQAPVSNAALTRLAAWLGGHQVEATVLLAPAALGGRGATALALEGEDLGVALIRPVPQATLARILAQVQTNTGVRPVVAYAGRYPNAVDAALAGGSGLALIVGEASVPGSAAPAGDGVYVLAGSAESVLSRLPAVVRSAAGRGEHIGSVSTSLRLSPAG